MGLIEDLGHAGEWERALFEAAGLAPVLEATQDAWNLVPLRALQTLFFARQGDVTEIVPLMAWLEDAGLQSESPQSVAYALLATSVARLRLGDAAATRRLLGEFALSRAFVPTVEYAAEVVRTALAGEDESLAAQLTAQFESCLPAGRLPFQAHAMMSVYGLLAEARGEHTAAEAHFADAAIGWRDLGVPYEEAQALLGQGRCLLELGRPPEARLPLSAARELLARLEAKPALAEADGWLAEVGAT